MFACDSFVQDPVELWRVFAPSVKTVPRVKEAPLPRSARGSLTESQESATSTVSSRSSSSGYCESALGGSCESLPGAINIPPRPQLVEDKPLSRSLPSSTEHFWTRFISNKTPYTWTIDCGQPCFDAVESRNKDHEKKEKKMVHQKPPGTIEYTVQPQDSLNSIALKFNITSNKLAEINKLFSHIIVPGQTLYVPDTDYNLSVHPANPASPLSSDADYDKLSDAESHLNASKQYDGVLSSNSEDEGPAVVKFLKMKCRYFTDGKGVVGGVMLITPNNVMFDPHKSDPLVIENGCEEYGLICPMEEIVSIALYSDISHMKLKDVLPSDIPKDLCPLYRPQDWTDLSSDRDLSPFNKFKAMGKEKCQNSARADDIPLESKTTELPTSVDGVCSDTAVVKESQTGVPEHTEGHRESQPVVLSEKLSTTSVSVAIPKENSRSEATTIGDLTTLVSSISLGCKEKSEEEAGSHLSEIRGAEIEATPKTVCLGKNVTLTPNDNKQNTNLLEALPTSTSEETCSVVKNAVELLQDCSPEVGSTLVFPVTVTDLPLPNNELDIINNGVLGICSSEVLDISQSTETVPVILEVPQVVVSGESSPETSSPEELQNKEIDSESEIKLWLLQKIQGPIEDIIPSKEERSKNPPMFLCLRVGKPMRKSFAVQSTFRTPQYSRKGSQTEYWFAVPQERVDQLYAFFVHWSPEVYGKEAKDQGFVVVEKDELDMIDNFFSAPPAKSWEIITVEEARRRKSVCSIYGEDGEDLIFPVLTDVSGVLGNHHIEKLIQHLPARTQGYAWQLMYSTSGHGTSLKTLYRKMACLDSPVLLVIKDMDDQVFGALASHPFRMSDHYYGTGETFLFTFNPDFQIFRWSGENSYFIKGDVDFLELGGGGSGYFGLWIDADLYYGRSNPCSTFNNETLSHSEDFTVQELEVWTFV